MACVSVNTNECNISPDSIKILKVESLKYMESIGIDTSCEEFSENPRFLKGSGCGIYGNATYGAENKRSGKICPEYLDGGYYIIFEPKTLKPKDIEYIAW